MQTYLPPLHLHVVFSQRFGSGKAWAERIERWFGGDEGLFAVPEPNIPVFVWQSTSSGCPPEIPWQEAARTALIVLADATLVGDPAWRAWTERQRAAMRPNDCLLPCTSTKHFVNAGRAFRETNAIRLDRVP